MGQNGVVTTRERRREEMTLPSGRIQANREDPPVKAVEASGGHSMLDRLVGVADRSQLRERDDAVLTLSDLNGRPIPLDRGSLSPLRGW
jgi:hypothetical protein